MITYTIILSSYLFKKSGGLVMDTKRWELGFTDGVKPMSIEMYKVRSSL